MTFSNKAHRLNAGSALPALALAALAATTFAATPAFAQAPVGPTPTPPAAGEINSGPNSPAQVAASTNSSGEAAPGSDEEIVVTGSLFRRTNTETPSPVTVLTADSLAKAGISTVNDAIRSISADSAGSIPTGFQGGFSAGGSAVSLRGLGVTSTLILIDGLRSTNYPLSDDGHRAYVDLNTIPFSAIERVEVLKDGASSTYGADAVGGVVNIIMKKHFTGLAGTVEGGISQRGDAGRQRANLTAGYGDYEEKGFNVYINAEYQHDGAVADKDRSFPFNTLDLSSIGGLDQNTADSSLSTATVNAVVRKTTQTDLNNPYTGGTAATGMYTTLNLNCPGNTFTVAGASGGVGCKHDNTFEGVNIQPKQERYAVDGRLSFRLSDAIEGYVTGSYAHDEVVIKRSVGSGIRQAAPYGALTKYASNNPGIVLPYFVCSAGINCVTAADRRLDPYNPYATDINATAATAMANAARIYYLFGDIPVMSDRNVDVYRAAAGLAGSLGSGFNWKIDGVYARSNLDLKSYGVPSIAGLKTALNTGAYNFFDPSQNSTAVRNLVAPLIDVPSHSTLASLDASVTKELTELQGGSLALAVGGQVRRETLVNNSLNPNVMTNPDLANYANTSAAFGKHTVSAGYFELDAPILEQLEVNASGRYDHYSEGFSRFSPKIGVKFTPIKQVALRGTYSQGFRAPTFAENNARSSYAGFTNFQPPASFQLVHGGLVTAPTLNTNPYALAYNVGTGSTGNPNLQPEKSRSFTAGIIAQPLRWLSFTADYYNVRKKGVVVSGPQKSAAIQAYYAGTALPPSYVVASVDAIDPLFPNALPRVLIISVPYTNGATDKTSGLDLSVTATIPFTPDVKLTSRFEGTVIFKYNRAIPGQAVQKYVGSLGPYDLSSGAGTPKYRANWQNTLDLGKFSVSVTTYYVSKLKNISSDDPSYVDGSCATSNLYGTGNAFCYIRRFIYADLNASIAVNDKFTVFGNVGNFTNAKAPVAPSSYSGTNYLPTWHYAGVIGRTFRAGANFRF